jgi:uncharacterized protein YcbK (DUF882 family)
MEIDPIQLLCSGNPLEAVVNLLKTKLAAAIADAEGKVTGAITALANKLKAGLKGLIPELPSKPSFLVDLLALKSKVEGDTAEFARAAKALVEKWGKAVGEISTIIEKLANLSICDLLQLNFKMNPDGSISLESPPPKTPFGSPEDPVAAEITTTNNYPEGYMGKNDAAVAASAELYETINNTKAGKSEIEAQKAYDVIVASPTYLSLLEKAIQQDRSETDTAVNGLSPAEIQTQADYINVQEKMEQAEIAVTALTLAADRSIEKIVQIVNTNDLEKRGKISSEEVESVIDNFPNEVDSFLNDKGSAKTESVKAVQAALRAQWKPIVEKQAQSRSIPAVEVVPGEDFTAWFNKQSIRNFTASEFISYFSRVRGGVTNSAPPRNLWPNILPALRLVDKMRDELASGVTIESSYRDVYYNKAVGGVSGSYHMKFMALDVSSNDPSKIYKILKNYQSRGDFAGGLQLYPSQGFVHIDTRGYNIGWKT